MDPAKGVMLHWADLVRGTPLWHCRAGTGLASQAGGWEAFQARSGGSTTLGPFAPGGLSRRRYGDQILVPLRS